MMGMLRSNPRQRSMGFNAEYCRRRVGKSVVGEIRAADRRIGRLEAVTVFDARQPRGLYLHDGASFVPIDFDADGRILVLSQNGTIDLSREPWGRKSVLNIEAACSLPCTSTAVAVGSFVESTWQGYLQHCRDNGDGTTTCVAIPYRLCDQVGACA